MGTPYVSRTPFAAGGETPAPYVEPEGERDVKRRRVDLSAGLDVSC
jgi:hypothetical protein